LEQPVQPAQQDRWETREPRVLREAKECVVLMLRWQVEVISEHPEHRVHLEPMELLEQPEQLVRRAVKEGSGILDSQDQLVLLDLRDFKDPLVYQDRMVPPAERDSPGQPDPAAPSDRLVKRVSSDLRVPLGLRDLRVPPDLPDQLEMLDLPDHLVALEQPELRDPLVQQDSLVSWVSRDLRASRVRLAPPDSLEPLDLKVRPEERARLELQAVKGQQGLLVQQDLLVARASRA
jgi:hypothetical protein